MIALISVPAPIARTSGRGRVGLVSGCATGGQPAHQQRRHHHLEQVPGGLAERRPERQRAVLVGQQVADHHPRPVSHPADERNAIPRRGQPDDRRDRTGELQLVAELRCEVVEGRQRRHAAHVPPVGGPCRPGRSDALHERAPDEVDGGVHGRRPRSMVG